MFSSGSFSPFRSIQKNKIEKKNTLKVVQEEAKKNPKRLFWSKKNQQFKLNSFFVHIRAKKKERKKAKSKKQKQDKFNVPKNKQTMLQWLLLVIIMTCLSSH